jgi:hypothetical protein
MRQRGLRNASSALAAMTSAPQGLLTGPMGTARKLLRPASAASCRQSTGSAAGALAQPASASFALTRSCSTLAAGSVTTGQRSRTSTPAPHAASSAAAGAAAGAAVSSPASASRQKP